MKLQPVGGTSIINAIAFGAADEPWAGASEAIIAAYRLAVNEYRGERSVQMIVTYARHLTASESA